MTLENVREDIVKGMKLNGVEIIRCEEFIWINLDQCYNLNDAFDVAKYLSNMTELTIFGYYDNVNIEINRNTTYEEVESQFNYQINLMSEVSINKKYESIMKSEDNLLKKINRLYLDLDNIELLNSINKKRLFNLMYSNYMMQNSKEKIKIKKNK